MEPGFNLTGNCGAGARGGGAGQNSKFRSCRITKQYFLFFFYEAVFLREAQKGEVLTVRDKGLDYNVGNRKEEDKHKDIKRQTTCKQRWKDLGEPQNRRVGVLTAVTMAQGSPHLSEKLQMAI